MNRMPSRRLSPNEGDSQCVSAAPIRLAFRVRPGENGAPTITDIQVEGVSFASAQRADLTAYLQQHNGSIPELAKHLGALSDKIALKADKVSADPAAEHGAGK